MKRWNQLVLVAAAITALAAGSASAQTATPRVDRREAMQRARIRQGIQSGQLSRGEARSLLHGERRIHRMEWRAKRDGHGSPRERLRLNRALNHQSARIWRLKHNGRRRV